MSINKAALLIAYQETAGADSSDAKGMRVDAQNYKDFLKSPYGGGWNDSEIILQLAPSASEIKHIIDRFAVGKDYTVIGFFGHGRYSPKDDDVMLQINPYEEISALSLRNRTTKSLIVIDCCRAIPIIRVFSESVEKFASHKKTLDIEMCKKTYEACIAQASEGNTILYACSQYEKSFGSANGGIYTMSLLRTAKNWESHLARTAEYEKPYCLSVVQAHNEASLMTKKRQANQHPDIEKSRSGPYLPFAVAFYKGV